MRAKNGLGSVVKWFTSLIAGHLTLSILGAIPVAYLVGWVEVLIAGGKTPMFDGFTLPPLVLANIYAYCCCRIVSTSLLYSPMEVVQGSPKGNSKRMLRKPLNMSVKL